MLSNVHNNDACLINFTVYLFSYVKFSWNQLTLKIYYRQKFSDLRYIYIMYSKDLSDMYVCLHLPSGVAHPWAHAYISSKSLLPMLHIK